MKIQIFDPFSTIWAHAFPMKRVEVALIDAGHNVTAVRCNGTFNENCVAMAGMNVQFTDAALKKSFVCHSCKQRKEILASAPGTLSLEVSHFLSRLDYELVNEIISDCDPSSWHKMVFADLPVGKIASYEFLLKHKINQLAIPQNLW